MAEKNKKILLALGSPSDGKRLLGDKRLAEIVDSERFKGVEVYLSIASAHRTPLTVIEHACGIRFKESKNPVNFEEIELGDEYHINLTKISGKYDIVIAGAGLANGLVSAHKAYAHRDTIVIGLPIFDSATQGLTSLLSTQEMPPGCPVGTVGIDRIDAAVDLALDLATREYEKILIINSALEINSPNYDDKCAEKLSSLGVKFELKNTHTELAHLHDDPEFKKYKNKNVLILSPYDVLVRGAENQKVSDKAIVIASYIAEGKEFDKDMGAYRDTIGALDRTMHVRFGGIENMAILAARIVANTTGNEDIKQKLREDFEKGLTKYEQWKNPIRLESAAHLSDAVVECAESR